MALLFGFQPSLWAQDSDTVLKGRVTQGNNPIPGALVRATGSQAMAIADENGEFRLKLSGGRHRIEVSYIGMRTSTIDTEIPFAGILEVTLEADGIALDEFELVSTGYQQIPRERATGSFAHLNQELVDRRISTNIIDRLEDLTPGLVFNRTQSARDPISIRGRNTIFANAMPLVIVDNFPYDGPLESINPNDIHSITVLRDAAAASIWGAQSGNGVIVITTKSGTAAGKATVSFNANATVSERPDLFYVPRMDVGEFIEIERELFGRNFYNSLERNLNRPTLSPAVEALIKARDGLTTQAEADAILESYKSADFRRELTDNYYRNPVFMQYSLNVAGGGSGHRYFAGFGYDNNASAVIGNSTDRFTLTLKDTWTNANGRLEVSNALFLTQGRSMVETILPQGFPYDRLRDDDGNHLEIDRSLSRRFKQSVEGRGLLDWAYVPLDEIGMADHRSKSIDWRINPGITYRLARGLTASAFYQYWSNTTNGRNRDPLTSFQTRDLINQFTQTGPGGSLSRPVPLGDILETSALSSHSHHLRGQLTYSGTFAGDHSINAIAGWEVKNLESVSSSVAYYGYRDDLGLSIPVDHATSWPRFQNPGQRATIRSGASHAGNTDRFVSYFANAGYAYRKRYDLTLSARKDQSNLFGVSTNRKGVPLWSAGLGWTISGESFADKANFPYMKLRGTYGYTGNLDRTLSSSLTARYLTSLAFSFIPNIPIAEITNHPNQDLRWEKIRVLNLALDFETSNGVFGGSFEWYSKEGLDLIGTYPVPAYTGLTTFRGNFANTLTRGFDLAVHANLGKSGFNWRPNFFWSHVDEKVTEYGAPGLSSLLLQSLTDPNPLPFKGRPLFSVYSYAWAGLNPDNGNPRGYLDGEPSENYFMVMNNTAPEDLVYHGPARPVHFGAFRNDLSWKGFSLSVNLSFRLGYYYRRTSVNYFTLNRGEIGHGDYHDRWKSPGDEVRTQIPSRPANADLNRHNFYASSAALVEKGDNIRLQDIRLAYAFDKGGFPKLPCRRIEIYSYANNLGILWKASDDPLDPDFRNMPQPGTFALGVRADF